MSVLVDTSIWVDHLRASDPELTSLLEEGAVVVHPFIVGELACGHLRRRDEILRLLQALPAVTMAGQDEVLHFIDANDLPGQGLGWVDMHLLASARLSGVALRSRDRALARAARRLGIPTA
ncbi:type II toxin-antitoxin system VapC family toxin [bacterium]|nr:type II toxin-antitoxin system VapC family toxin [bacterium]